MADTVRLRKRSGGSSLTWEGEHYSWPHDGAVTEVPYALALALLGIPDGDYSALADEPAWEVTEPAPRAVHAVTEPAPKASVSEGSRAPESGAGSPVTPKPRAGTRTRPGTAAKK